MRGSNPTILSVFLLVLLSTGIVLAKDPNPLDPAGAPPPVRRAVFRAEKAHARTETGEAVRILAESLAAGEDRDHPSLRYRLGAYLMEDGRAAEAFKHLKKASRQAPGSEAVWLDYARASYEISRYETAADAFARAYTLQVEEAREHDEHDEQAEQLDPSDLGLEYGYGHHAVDPRLLYFSSVSWIMAERPTDAADILVPLVAAYPDTVPQEWVRSLVSAAAASGQPARADEGVERLLREHSDVKSAWVLASQQAQLRKDLESAAIRLQIAGWFEPPTPEELRLLADLFGAAGVPRQAARYYSRLWPDEPDLARHLASAWMHAHEPDSARVVLQEALEQKSDSAMYMLLGDLEFGVEKWDQARNAYTRTSDLDPGNGRAWLMQGISSMKLGDIEPARQELGKAAASREFATEAQRLLEYLDTLDK